MLDWGSVVLGFGAGMVVTLVISMTLDRYFREEVKLAEEGEKA